MKKGIAALLAAFTSAALLLFPMASHADGIEVDAKAAILMDAASGTVVYEHNADEKYDAAGMVKIASALVIAKAVDGGRLDAEAEVSVPSEAAKLGGMSAFLNANERYNASELIKAMMMISANDATVALANAVSGSEGAFVDEMTAAASALGASPVFVNPTGHRADGQRMSARDAAIIARELVKYDFATEYARIYTDTLTHADGRVTELANPNRLVRFYTGCDGLMTGSNGDGYSGAYTAERDGNRYIAVIIGAANNSARNAAAEELLDYAFANYENAVVIEEGKGVARDVEIAGGRQKTVHGVAGETLTLLLRKGESSSISKEVVLFENIEAPVAAGDALGELIIKKDGAEIARVPVVAHQTVEKSSVGSALRSMWLDWLGK